MSSPKSNKKSDPLQNFLIFAALFLVCLYALEEWRRFSVEAGALRAERFTKELSVEGCIVYSSGLDGDLFVVDCPNKKHMGNLEEEVREGLKIQKFIIETSHASLLCEQGCSPIR